MNDSAQMDLRERPAKLAGDPENIGERHVPVFGLQGTAVITQLTPRKVLENEVLGHGLEVEVVEGNNVVMWSCLPEHFNFSPGGMLVVLAHYDRQSDLSARLAIPG
jgi:hypothetical protein